MSKPTYQLANNESPSHTQYRNNHTINNQHHIIDQTDDIESGLYTDDVDLYAANNDDEQYSDVNIDSTSNQNTHINGHDKQKLNQFNIDSEHYTGNDTTHHHSNSDLVDTQISPMQLKSIHQSVTAVDGIEVDPQAFATLMNQTVWQLLSENPFLVFVSFFAALDGILFGYDTGIISGTIVFDGFRTDMGLPLAVQGHTDSEHTASIVGWIVGSLMLGAAISSLLAGQFAHIIGRKPSIVIGAAASTIGGIIQSSASSVSVLIVGRVIVGLGIGCVSTVVPIYVAEISPKSIRGSLGTLMNLFVTFGQLSAFCVNLAFDKLSHKQSDWRFSLGIQAVLSFFLLLGLFALPESPRFLISKQRIDEARSVLKRLRQSIQVGQRLKSVRLRSDGSESHEYESITNIDLEILDVETELSTYQYQNYSSWLDLITHKPYLFPLTIGILLQFFQQFSGINAIMYYAPTIFSTIQIDRQVASVFTGLVNWLSTFIAVVLIDRVGRRPLLLYGGLAQAIACFIVAILLYAADPQQSHASAAGVLSMICLFIFNFAYSWGPVVWVLCSEIFPIQIRSKAIATTTMINWLCNFCVSKAVPTAISANGFGTGGVFIWFAVCSLISVIYVFVSVCETMNCTLEQLDRMFAIQSWNQYIEFCRRNILQYKFGKHWVNTNEFAGDENDDNLDTSITIDKSQFSNNLQYDEPI